MKTKLLFIGLLAFISLNSFKGEKNSETKAKAELSAANVAGIIVDEVSGETLVGVEVSIEGTNLKTYTDFDGNFAFENVAVGEYSISAKLVSYKEIEGKKLNVNVNNNDDLKLKMNLKN